MSDDYIIESSKSYYTIPIQGKVPQNHILLPPITITLSGTSNFPTLQVKETHDDFYKD